MAKNIALLALDGEEVVEEPVEVSEERVEPEDVQEIEEVSAEIESDQDVIEEAQETSETIGEMADKIEAKEEGIDEEAAEMVEVAVEHFCQRLGYPFKKVGLAVESFGEPTRKEKSKELVKNLRIAQETIDKQISIAQEGLWDKIKTKFDKLFTSNKKLAKQLQAVSQKYDANGPKEENITGKFLSTYLNPENKAEVTGKDVVKQLTDISKLVKEQEIVDLVKHITDIAAQMVGHVSSSVFIAKDEEVEAINKLAAEVGELLGKINVAVEGKNKSSGAETILVPVQKTEKEKLVNLTNDLIYGNALEKAEDALDNKISALWNATFGQANSRLAGKYADDIRAARRAVELLVDVSQKVGEIVKISLNVTYAAVRYLELSTKK